MDERKSDIILKARLKVRTVCVPEMQSGVPRKN